MEFKQFWYSNLFRELEKTSEKEVCEKVKKYKACGVVDVIIEMQKQMDDNQVKGYLEQCGKCCIDPAIINSAKEVFIKSNNNIDEVLDMLRKKGMGGNMHRVENIVYASYEQCYCPNRSEKDLPPIYCNCSKGWFIELFSKLLDKPVQVDLKCSIIRGADTCDFIIHI